jgi:hypothetical protein
MSMPKLLTDEEIRQHGREASVRSRHKRIAYFKEQGPEVYEEFRKQERRKDLAPSRRFRVLLRLAKKKGLSHTLTLEQYTELINKPCHYCGKSLYGEYGVGLDRINNDRSFGYDYDNVLPACADCNKGRHTFFTVKEFKVMIKALLEYRKIKNI